MESLQTRPEGGRGAMTKDLEAQMCEGLILWHF